jgi:hypothetical protein
MNKPVTVSYAFKKDGKGERHGTPAERLLAAQAFIDSIAASDASNESYEMKPNPFEAPVVMSREISYAFKKDGKGERHGTPAERLLAAQARKNNAFPQCGRESRRWRWRRKDPVVLRHAGVTLPGRGHHRRRRGPMGMGMGMAPPPPPPPGFMTGPNAYAAAGIPPPPGCAAGNPGGGGGGGRIPLYCGMPA